MESEKTINQKSDAEKSVRESHSKHQSRHPAKKISDLKQVSNTNKYIKSVSVIIFYFLASHPANAVSMLAPLQHQVLKILQ